MTKNHVLAGVSVTYFPHGDGRVVLLGKRKGGTGNGLWAFPGGMMELGECIVKTAIREMFEETGLNEFEVVHPNYRLSNNLLVDGTPWLTHFVLMEGKEGKLPLVMEPDKCWFWGFFPTNKFPLDLFPPTKEYMNRVGWSNCAPEEQDRVIKEALQRAGVTD